MFKGKYFEAELVDETLEVTPLYHSQLVFSRTEARLMRLELGAILELDRYLMNERLDMEQYDEEVDDGEDY